MTSGDRFWRKAEQRAALQKAESEHRVADSMEVRDALMRRVEVGEITLEQCQAELRVIKRNAKRNGLVTRTQAYNGQ